MSIQKKHFIVSFSFWIALTFFYLTIDDLFANTDDDKNGVSPNTISLPSGPGSIEGLGESFQPVLNSGSARYEVKIKLPQGTAGSTPTLSLRYESGFGDGAAGIGWVFGPGAITRKTDKGIPRYVDGPNGADDDHDGKIDDVDEEDLLVGLEGEELVKLADDSYRARIEGTFLKYHKVDDHWVGFLKNGTRLEFGLTPNTRISDAGGEKVFKWLLEKSTDTNGNVIEYTYAGFEGSDNQKYLTEIRYGPGVPPWQTHYFVSLSYESRPDFRKDYRSGFQIKTTHRLSQIDIGIQGVLPDQCLQGDLNYDGITDALIRRYLLTYDDTSTCRASFLTRVTQYGANGTDYLPPISFSYSSFEPERFISGRDAVILSNNPPNTVMDNQLVELIDMNRDGLPDILKTDYYGGSHTCYRNLGVQEHDGTYKIKWDNGQSVTSQDGLALQLHLDQKQVHLADMDGNGLSDLIHTLYTGEVNYYLNNGDFSWKYRQSMAIQDAAPPAPFTNDNVKTTDMDFDKRMDVVMSNENGYTTWFNLGKSTYSQSVRTTGAVDNGQVIQFSQTGVHLADLNGDRMGDVVRIRPTHMILCANMGHGLFDDSISIPIPDIVLTDGTGSQIDRARLEDINGDGLADLLIERATGNELWYWLNLGTDAFSQKHVITDMPTLFSASMVTRWADINGNGTTDLIYADSSHDAPLRVLDIGILTGGSDHPNLLTSIDNGLGVVTQITYKTSTDHYITAQSEDAPWEQTIPFPVSIIDRVVTTTGLDTDTHPGNDTYTKAYRYIDGYYEDMEKAFRGFEEVQVTEHGDESSPASISIHTFHTGGPDGIDNDGDNAIDEVSQEGYREEEALKGMVKSVSVTTADHALFSIEEQNWAVRNLAMGEVEVRHAYNRRTENRIYEGTDTPEVIRTDYAYDLYGNVTEEKKYGALSITGDELFTYTEYIHDTDRWILQLPARQYQTDALGEKLSETLSYYDGIAYEGLDRGQVDKGNLTRQQGWVKADTYIDGVRNAYDQYGNIIGIKGGVGNLRQIEYDPNLYTFPINEIIEVGQGKPDLSISVSYNIGLGVVTESRDFNDYATTYRYDCFGRLVSIVKPGDSTEYPTLQFTYTMSDPHNSLVYTYDPAGALTLDTGIRIPSSVSTFTREQFSQPGTFDSIQYVDGLGRKLATMEEAENGAIVKEAALFNAKGSVRYSFLPYEAETFDYQPPSPDINSSRTDTRYDAAGKVVQVINPPDKDGVVTHASSFYAPLKKTVTDENQISKSFFNDGLDRLIEVHEKNQGETYVTRYTFDPLGSLTQIIDAQNNIKTLAYDGLKRKTEMDDPDAGHKSYQYDDNGNLIQTTDNKGQVIVYTYDAADRVLSEDYLDDQGITPDISFHYDAPSEAYPDATNLKGQLAWVQDLSGAQFFSYDSRGNDLWNVKRIHTNQKSVASQNFEDFKFLYTYDAMDRITAMTYPDGDEVSYRYNSRTLLKAIPGVVSNIDYNAAGQIAAIDYINGVSTAYTYDPRHRLTHLETISTQQPSQPIQDLQYTMDGVGNITTILDGRDIPENSPANATQSFQYDDLYRLTHSQGPGYGAIDFQYDKIGNMIHKKSPDTLEAGHIEDDLINLGTMEIGGVSGAFNRIGRLPGDAPGPHAVTATESGLVYEYDGNGNMINHADGDIYTWDFKDRLMTVLHQSKSSAYTYDYSGQRVTKTVSDGDETKTTLYPSKTFEIRDGKPIKYIFSDIRRIAQLEGQLTNQNNERSEQAITFQPGWNFFSLNVEPDDSDIFSVLSAIDGQYTDVWLFDAESQTYVGHFPDQGIFDLTEIHAHTGYMIYVTTESTLIVNGLKQPSNDLTMQNGWNLIGCPYDTDTPIEEALLPINGEYESVWYYDTTNDLWRQYSPIGDEFLNDLTTMEPGNAYWVEMEISEPLSFVISPQNTHFYHPDHLGSSNMVTDTDGNVVESTEFYPFGRPRHEVRNNFDSAYKYTGKELDHESGLMYYEARYYNSVIGRFISVDPVLYNLNVKLLNNPQKLNAFSYSYNCPINVVDPSGKLGVAAAITAVSMAKGISERWTKEHNYSVEITNLEKLKGKLNSDRGYYIDLLESDELRGMTLDENFQPRFENDEQGKIKLRKEILYLNDVEDAIDRRILKLSQDSENIKVEGILKWVELAFTTAAGNAYKFLEKASMYYSSGELMEYSTPQSRSGFVPDTSNNGLFVNQETGEKFDAFQMADFELIGRYEAEQD